MLVGKWNDWQTSLIFMLKRTDLYTLQYLLQRILNEYEFMKKLMQNAPTLGVDMTQFTLPTETLKYALCVIAAGPMLVIFPFFQKYFASGLTIGAVKG